MNTEIKIFFVAHKGVISLFNNIFYIILADRGHHFIIVFKANCVHHFITAQ